MADFYNKDFHYPDFDTESLSIVQQFTSLFWKLLSPYIQSRDSYKDENEQGLLERYLVAFGEEVDNNLLPSIENYMTNIDAALCEGKFLEHISDVLGSPPDIFGDYSNYRNLLTYVVSVYKIKGTLSAYKLFFDLLGFNIDIYEIPVVNSEGQYDGEGEYDTGNELSVYDQDICSPCSSYDITFYPKIGGNITINSTILSRLKEAISFNEPINAKLRKLTFSILLEEEIDISISDTLSSDTEGIELYDVGLLHDNAVPFDSDSIIGTDILEKTLSITSSLVDTNEYRYSFTLDNDLDGASIVYTDTQLTLEAKDNNGDTIYIKTGTLTGISLGGSNINGFIITDPHIIFNLSSITLKGFIVLDDGTKTIIDNNLNTIGQTNVPLFFV